MDTRDRRCGLCGQMNPPAAQFCAECGEHLVDVPESRLSGHRQTQFALPDYLLVAREREREERRRRMSTETGEGVGLIWLGGIAAVLALWFGGGLGFGVPIFLLGMALVLFGLWRLRRDTRNMARAGTATVVISSVVLGATLVQTLGFNNTEIPAPQRAMEPPTPTPDPAETPSLELSGYEAVPMFRGNASRTGENPGPGPGERPMVAWKTFVGGESYASPVVGQGKVYVATKGGSVVALSLSDGDDLWRVDVGDYIARSTPALDGRTLYVAAGYTFLALDADTGQERWRVPLRFAGSCSPVVAGDQVIVATQEGHVSAIATENGDELWHYRDDNLLFGSPAVAEGAVVFGDEAGQVTALDAGTGRELWQERVEGEVFSTPAIADGRVYVATSEPSLVAFDIDNGRLLWRRGVGGESSPAVIDGVVYLGSEDQSLRAFDAETGEPRWSSPLGYPIQASVTVSEDVVFVGSGPTLNALRRRDGQTLWTHVTGGEVTADVAVVAGKVIAASHDGYVYALGASDAAQSTSSELPKRVGGVLLPSSR